MYCSVLCRRNVNESMSIKREWVRLIMNARNSPKLLNEEPLQRVENDIDRKNYAPSSFKNPCPGIKTLNHIES